MPGTHTAHSDPDIYDEAMRGREEGPVNRWGQVKSVYLRWVAMTAGKPDFDERLHEPWRKRVEISIVISPIDASRPLDSRSFLNRGTPRAPSDYEQVVGPSLQMLREKVAQYKNVEDDGTDGFALKNIEGLWAHYQSIPKPGNKEGETYRTIQFLDVYPDKESCKIASEFAGAPSLDEVEEIPFPGEESKSEKFEREKVAMWPILESLWMQSGRNIEAFVEKLSASETLLKYYAVDDPKVVELLKAPF